MALLFKRLAKHRQPILKNKCEDIFYYKKHNSNLDKIKNVYKFNGWGDLSYRIILTNIISKSVENKTIIENVVFEYKEECEKKNVLIDTEVLRAKVKEKLKNMRYFEYNNLKIYIPIFTNAMNLIYTDEPEKLLRYPYSELREEFASSCIDLFDIYGYKLFASSFAHLIKIDESKTSAAFFHYDFQTLYIINSQGRLDATICLTDRRDHNQMIYQHHLIKKVQNVVKGYYSNSRSEFIDSLLVNGFISDYTYSKLYHKLSIRLIRKMRILKAGKDADEVL